MQQDLTRWTRAATDDGVRLCDPTGQGTIAIRVRAGHVPPSLGSLVTDEGEYAHRCDGPDGLVAIIPGDRASIEITGTCQPRIFDELVRGFVTGRDPVRARELAYRPPAGWLASRRPLATRWTSPDGALLEVRDAIPIGSTAIRAAELLAGRAATGAHDGEPLVTAAGLRGTLRRPRGNGLIAEFGDARFTYAFHLAGPPSLEETLRALIDSAQPVPAPRRPIVEEGFAWAI